MYRFGIGLIAIFLILTCLRWARNQFTDGVNDIFPSLSPEKSRSDGTFVAFAKFEPDKFTLENQQVEVGAVWVERESHLHHRMIWIPYREFRPSFWLCFTLRKGSQLFLPPNNAVLTKGGAKGAFHVLSRGRLFFNKLDDLPRAVPISVLAAGNTWEVGAIKVEGHND